MRLPSASSASIEIFPSAKPCPIILAPAGRTISASATAPAAGAGASGAQRVNAPDELEEAIARSGVDHGSEIAVEEFVEGHEGFYDTISIDGHVATHYYPNVLEAMRTRWISPQFVATNRLDGEASYDELKEMGRAVIDALDIGTSATHM